MATNWTAEQLSAYNSIKEDGVSIVIRNMTFTSYNPKTDTTTGATNTDYPTYAINIQFKEKDDAMVHIYRNAKTNVRRGDRMLLVPAYGLPDISNAGSLGEFEIHYNSYKYKIIDVASIEPGGTSVLFKIAARRLAPL